MRLLAIETSTEACSIAVWVDGDVRERHEIAPRRHTQLALRGRGPRIVAAIDARMGEVYVGAFTRDDDGLVHADGDERVCAPADAPFPEAPFAALGTGFAADDGALARRAGARAMALDATALPHAADLARLGDALFRAGGAIAPDHVEPAYLRDKVALTLEEQGRPRPAR